MRFPSKVTPYKESSVAKFPAILMLLEKADISPSELYGKVRKNKVRDIGEFTEILGSLYAMGKIELTGGLIHLC